MDFLNIFIQNSDLLSFPGVCGACIKSWKLEKTLGALLIFSGTLVEKQPKITKPPFRSETGLPRNKTLLNYSFLGQKIQGWMYNLKQYTREIRYSIFTA
jgi:hypothetical protein